MKVLILSCPTGAGHNAAAHAVGEELQKEGVEVVYLDHTNPTGRVQKKHEHSAFNKFVDECFLKRRWVFGMFYSIALGMEKLHYEPVYAANKKYAKGISRYIDDNHIDAVVCTHMYPLDTMYYVRQKYNPNIPVYAVLTDYRPHPFFALKIRGVGKFRFMIPGSDRNVKFFVKKAYPEGTVMTTGIPVSEKFRESISKEEAREKLGWPKDKKIILVINSRDGSTVSACRKLNKLMNDNEMCVFDSLNNSRSEKRIKKFAKDDKFIIISYSDNFELCLRACDVVFTKAGGLTTTEAAVVGTPLVHTACMPWLENQNAKYFAEKGMCIHDNNSLKAVDLALELLRDDERCAEMVKKQKELINGSASIDIAKEIVKG